MEQISIEENKTGPSFDINRFFSKLLSNYYWFILTVAVFGTAAFFYLRYTQPLYELSTYVLVKGPNDAVNTTLGGSAFNGSGASNPQSQQINPSNEIIKLQAESLLGEVVDSLRTDISVVKFGRVRSKTEALDDAPFEI